MEPSIGLVSASDFLGSIRKAEQHAENACICKIVFASATISTWLTSKLAENVGGH